MRVDCQEARRLRKGGAKSYVFPPPSSSLCIPSGTPVPERRAVGDFTPYVGNNATIDRRLIPWKCQLKCPIVSTLCASRCVLQNKRGNMSFNQSGSKRLVVRRLNQPQLYATRIKGRTSTPVSDLYPLVSGLGHRPALDSERYTRH